MSIDIISTGRYASDHILNNDMLSKMVDTNSQWIVERTGILEGEYRKIRLQKKWHRWHVKGQ